MLKKKTTLVDPFTRRNVKIVAIKDTLEAENRKKKKEVNVKIKSVIKNGTI